MNQTLSRRKLIKTGLATAGGLCSLGVAAVLAERYGLVPPDHGGIFGMGETMTYAAQRILMSRHSLAREFNRSEISKVAPINGKPPRPKPFSACWREVSRTGASPWAAWWHTRLLSLSRNCSVSLHEPR